MDAFGQRLRGFRKASGLLQEERAARIGLPATAMSKIEKETRDVTLAEASAPGRALASPRESGKVGPGCPYFRERLDHAGLLQIHYGHILDLVEAGRG